MGNPLDLLFGESQDVPAFPTVSTPSFNLEGGKATPTDASAFTAQLQKAPGLFTDLENLRTSFALGSSEAREAGLNQVRQTFAERRGTLKTSLQKRKVAGSSFGNAELNNLTVAEAAARSDTARKAFLEEFAAISDTIRTEADIMTKFIGNELALLNIAQQNAAYVDNNARFSASLAAEESAARAEGLFTIAGLGLTAFGEGGVFGPPSPTPTFNFNLAGIR